MLSIRKLKPVKLCSGKSPIERSVNYNPCLLSENDTRDIPFSCKGGWQLQPPHCLTLLSHFKLPKFISHLSPGLLVPGLSTECGLLKAEPPHKQPLFASSHCASWSGLCHGISQEYEKLSARDNFVLVTIFVSVGVSLPTGCLQDPKQKLQGMVMKPASLGT